MKTFMLYSCTFWEMPSLRCWCWLPAYSSISSRNKASGSITLTTLQGTLIHALHVCGALLVQCALRVRSEDLSDVRMFIFSFVFLQFDCSCINSLDHHPSRKALLHGAVTIHSSRNTTRCYSKFFNKSRRSN
jgi:hypothetical protein